MFRQAWIWWLWVDADSTIITAQAWTRMTKKPFGIGNVQLLFDWCSFCTLCERVMFYEIFEFQFSNSVLSSFARKNHSFCQNSHLQNLIFVKIHIFKISFLTKFTLSKSHFWQNSHFQNLIFDKIHIFKISVSTKFTFSKSHLC